MRGKPLLFRQRVVVTHHFFRPRLLRFPAGLQRVVVCHVPGGVALGFVLWRAYSLPSGDQQFRNVLRQINNCAVGVLSPKPIMDRLGGRDLYFDLLSRHQAAVLTSATAPLARSSEHSSVSSADSMRRSEWPSLASGSCFIG